jgi:hypothetical protein
MRILRSAVTVAAAGVIAVACGQPSRLETVDADLPAEDAAPGVVTPAPAAAVQLEQPAVWPAPDVVFATPEEAAADFVSSVFGVEPALGEYRAGDQRSGEIDVLYAGAEVSTPQVRSGLLVRKLTPTEGWFVLGGSTDAISITAPVASATVARGPLTVTGSGRGFEGTLNVSAFPIGDASAPIDTAIAQGGALEAPEPFSVTLDLSSAAPGTVVVLVRGDTGLDGDPGEFTVIPITVADVLPPTR